MEIHIYISHRAIGYKMYYTIEREIIEMIGTGVNYLYVFLFLGSPMVMERKCRVYIAP